MKNKSKSSFIQHKIYSTMINACIALGLCLELSPGQLQEAPESESTTTQPKADEAEWFTDFEAAKKLASKENRPILLFFTGSDWCLYCKILKKDVLDTEAFLNGVKNKWVLMEVDLPKNKSKISAETLAQNNLLKDYFGVSGFPRVLVISPDGNPLGVVGRTDEPESYLKSLDSYLNIASEYKKRIEDSEKIAGEAKAEALTGALNLVNKSYVHFHTESIATLEKLTESGEAKAAVSLLDSLKQRKETIKEAAKSRIMDPEFEKLGKAGWMNDLEAAKAKAAKEGKYLFIHFLKPSQGKVKEMLNNVYYQPEFKTKTEDDWILVEIDYEFEREIKPRTPQFEKNEAIWNAYGPSVYRTTSVCAFADGRPFSINHYWGSMAPVGLEHFFNYLATKKEIGDKYQKMLKLAEASKGEERAVLLDEFFYSQFEYRLERISDFKEQYAHEIKQLIEADPEAKLRVTKLVLMSYSKLRELGVVENKVQGWTKIGNLATRYFDEHDTSKFPQLRSKLYRLQAYSQAYQGNKMECDKALASLLSKELANTRGRHTQYRSEKHVKAVKERLADILSGNVE